MVPPSEGEKSQAFFTKDSFKDSYWYLIAAVVSAIVFAAIATSCWFFVPHSIGAISCYASSSLGIVFFTGFSVAFAVVYVCKYIKIRNMEKTLHPRDHEQQHETHKATDTQAEGAGPAPVVAPIAVADLSVTAVIPQPPPEDGISQVSPQKVKPSTAVAHPVERETAKPPAVVQDLALEAPEPFLDIDPMQLLTIEVKKSKELTTEYRLLPSKRVGTNWVDKNLFEKIMSGPRPPTERRYMTNISFVSELDSFIPDTVTIDGDGPIGRCIAVMFGMAIGDSFGSQVEFVPYIDGEPVRHFQMKPIRTLQGIPVATYGSFNLLPGQFTDDTSMGLCLADAITMYGLPENPRCQIGLMNLFLAWWDSGYNNAFRNELLHPGSVGLGGNINDAMKAFRRETTALTTAGTRMISGNGSLMRNGPVAIAARSVEEAMICAYFQSKVTHQGDEAAFCCELMAYIIFHAIHCHSTNPEEIKLYLLDKIQDFAPIIPESAPKPTTLDGSSGIQTRSFDAVKALAGSKSVWPNTSDPRKSENWNWLCLPDEHGHVVTKFSFNPDRLGKQPGYIGSYAMDALAMALHCVFSTDSFAHAVAKATVHGGDSDTVGAIIGQIAGAIYGFHGLKQSLSDPTIPKIPGGFDLSEELIGLADGCVDGGITLRALRLALIGELLPQHT